MDAARSRAAIFAIFVIGTIFNIIIDTWCKGVVRWLIRGGITRIAEETLAVEAERKSKKGDHTPLETVEARVEKMGGNELFGATIGFVERELFIYALAYGAIAILQAVIVFKGFAGWVTVGVTDKSQGSKVLSHFYAYTIGNLISLGIAIAFYELSLLVYHGLSSLSGWPI